MKSNPEQTTNKNSTLFFIFVYLTIVAYLARIAEIFPALATFRVNFLLFVTTLILFVLTGEMKNIKIKGNIELLLMTGFVLSGLLSVPFSVWPGNALQTCQGSIMINMAIFLFCLAVIKTEKQLHGTISTIICSCAILLYGLTYRPVIAEEYRISTTSSYDSNDIALLFVFAFPVASAFFVASKLKGKLLACIIMVGLAQGIVTTGSRGGMIAFGIACLLLIFSSGIGLKLFYKLVVVIMIAMFVLSPTGDGLRERFATLMSGKDYNTVNTNSAAGGRLAIWKSGLVLLLNNPIVGVGAGNSPTAMGQKHGDASWRTMHNSYLQIAVETGLIGLSIYLAMLCAILKNCKNTITILARSTSQQGKRLLSVASSMQIGFIAYMIAGFFLSQAFSPIVPLSLAFSNRLQFLATRQTPQNPENQ